MRRAPLAAIVLLAACGLFPRPDAKPRRAKPNRPLRARPAPRGPATATIPQEAPTIEYILGGGLLAGISDPSNGLLDDTSAIPGEVAWLTARIGRADADEARTLVALRRAAFGVHVPAAGERGEIDDDVLEDRQLGIDTGTVALIGTEAPCLTRRGAPVVTAIELGGHAVDVRWPLLDCGPGPWAPLAIAAVGIPKTLRWAPPRCDGTDPAEAAWASTNDDALVRLGSLWDGERLVGLVGDGALWLPGPKGWMTRSFSLAGARAVPCAIEQPDAAAPDPSPVDAPLDDGSEPPRDDTGDQG